MDQFFQTFALCFLERFGGVELGRATTNAALREDVFGYIDANIPDVMPTDVGEQIERYIKIGEFSVSQAKTPLLYRAQAMVVAYQDQLRALLVAWTILCGRLSNRLIMARYSGSEPCSTVSRWCKLLVKRGYKVALVDEHYTSKRCSSCKLRDSVCTPGKDWRKTKCNVCSAEHNRDKNACLNMLEIVQAHVRGEARPYYLHFGEYERVLEPHKSPARKIVHEAARCKPQKIQNYDYKPSTTLRDTAPNAASLKCVKVLVDTIILIFVFEQPLYF